MFDLYMFLYAVVLFFVLTPGVLLSLPPKGSKYVVALTHALVYGVVMALSHKYVWRLTHVSMVHHKEGMKEVNKPPRK